VPVFFYFLFMFICDIISLIRRVVVLGIETHDKCPVIFNRIKVRPPTAGWGVANILNKQRNTYHCF
jgi:hypothetical protein